MCGGVYVCIYLSMFTLYTLWRPRIDSKNLPLCLCHVIFVAASHSQSQSALMRLVVLASLQWGAPVPAFQTWSYRQATAYTAFVLSSGCLNLGSFACKPSVLASKPSSWNCFGVFVVVVFKDLSGFLSGVLSS